MTTQTVLITGGSKGLGLCTTQRLLEKSFQVIVLSRSQGQLGELLKNYPNHLHWIHADFADKDSIARAFKQVNGVSSNINALILNAAQTIPMPFSQMDTSDLEQNIAVNITSALLCLQYSLKLLRGGRAIFISTESVDKPFPLLSIYAATKAAVETAFTGLRGELYKDFGIQLTSLRAGYMADTAFGEAWPPEVAEAFFKLAEDSGSLRSGGSPMPASRVATMIEHIIELPQDVTINRLDVRSGDSS
ncbi:SDR family NAD(P)-dependent oxidoreductase [Spongiibacter sp. KMU-166]|uniref:SDR family NAD(P)-dependent oxidoreductase n=1 Tax=Spongiibacter thalassae TaxID=2721624 RepID=A0ABX1GBK9_9GAMM|nr:SDR family NAD(P)-dependent oxidoreductase [Spongiibacter thalassae]NKI16544.1 SDR family NAD(P)-dependent oxidoreductase [Spongiibacter thalassae]